MIVGWVAAALAVVVSMPWWLPRVVIAARVKIFELVNGDEGVQVPVEDFKRVYANPAADGRSRGAALSDLFWYWLAPGPAVHQEHLEPGPRYDEVARVTRHVLARLRKDEWAALTGRCAKRVLDGVRSGTAVRLRDLMMPIWAEVYFEAVFQEECPPGVRDLIVANADDVVSALKCTRLRHMGRRARLTRYLRERIDAGTVPFALPTLLTPEEQAYYLQGTFFNTAIVQMSEGMAHLGMALAAHPALQEALRAAPTDTDLLDRVLDETLRVYPLFGIAHRITSADIVLDSSGAVIPRGSVVLFNYAEYQHAALPDGARFDPDHFARHTPGQLNHVPFGITANRPCPARGVAPLSMRVVAAELISRFQMSTSASHTRSLPNRGPVLLSPVDHRAPRLRLTLMWVRDRCEDVTRSLTQLVLGTYMILDARRLKLCQTYFL
jgi:hypothetical protein